MPKYNGHKNWNHWNVSLWLNNDEGLYRLMVHELNSHRGKRGARERAAYSLLTLLPEKTPDGAPYSVSSVKAAMADL
jgi:hypothetical protein